MKAGEIFEMPDDGDIAISINWIFDFRPNDERADEDGNVRYLGFIVSEYDDELGGWGTVCPLVDFPMLYPTRVNELPSMRA